MMRRGPEGPRTLCNACGLMWANKVNIRAVFVHVYDGKNIGKWSMLLKYKFAGIKTENIGLLLLLLFSMEIHSSS